MHSLVARDTLCQSPVSSDEEVITRHKRRANLQQQLEYKNRENAKLNDKCKQSLISLIAYVVSLKQTLIRRNIVGPLPNIHFDC